MDISLSNLGQPRPPFWQQGISDDVPRYFAQHGGVPQLDYNAMPLSQNIDDRRGDRARSELNLMPLIGMGSPQIWDTQQLMNSYGQLSQMPYGGPNVPVSGLAAAAGANDVAPRSLADLLKLR